MNELELIKTFIKGQNRKTLLIMAVMIIVIILLLIWNINKTLNYNDKMDRLENNIDALTSEVKVVKHKNDSTNTYVQKVVEVQKISEITSSEYFKNLSKDQQKFYKEMEKQKGLLFGIQADINVIKRIVKVIPLDSAFVVDETDTTLTLKKGSNISFSDSTDVFKYAVKLDINNPMKADITWKYYPKVTMKVLHKNTDGTYDVEVQFNDSNAEVSKIYTVKLPEDQVECNFWCKVKKGLKYTGRVVGIFAGGILVGLVL